MRVIFAPTLAARKSLKIRLALRALLLLALAGGFGNVASAAAQAGFMYSNSGNGCTGDTLFFTNTSTGAIGYQWDFGDGSQPVSLTDPAHVFASAGTFTVSLLAWDAAGDTAVATSTVNFYPQASAQFFVETNPVCPGTPLELVYGFSPSLASLEWDFDDGTTATQVAPQHSYAVSGTYNISLAVAGVCGADTFQLPVEVTDSAFPVANFNVQSQVVCPGEPVAFNNSSQNGAIAYKWFFGDGDTSTLVNPIHTFLSPGGYDATLVAYSACATDTLRSYLPASDDTLATFIIVDSTLVPSAAIAANPNPVCPGDTVQFAVVGNGLSGYAWNFGDGVTAGSPMPQHTYNQVGTYTVQLTAFNYCGHQTTVNELVTVDAGLLPNPEFTWFPHQLCPGAEVQFVNQTQGATALAWHFGDGTPSDSADNPLHTFAPAGTFSVTLIAENACGLVDSLHKQITVDSLLQPEAHFFVPQTGPVCPGDTLQLQSNTLGGTALHWDFGDGNTTTGTNPSHAWAAAGVYPVQLTATNACGNMDSVINYVSVAASATPAVTISVSATNVCPGDPVLLQNINPSPATTYTWSFGDGASMAGESVWHTYASSGVYTAILTAANSCGSSTDSVQIVALAVGEPQFSVQGLCSSGVTVFTDQTLSSSGVRTWDFGDGTIVQSPNPTHTYSAAGSYVVTLCVPVNGCMAAASDTIQISAPAAVPSITLSSQSATCPDSCNGSLQAAVSGGNAPYSFVWNTGQTDSVANALCAGSYTVSVEDASQCLYIHTDSVQLLSLPLITDTTVGAACTTSTGSVSLAIAGGIGPFTYLWNDADAQTSQTATGLPVGNYSVSITDGSGCLFHYQANVPDVGDLELVSFNIQNVSCFGDTDGSGTAVVTGGTAPLSFLWNDQAMQATQTAIGLPPGNYSVTVSDPNGCMDFDLATIGEPDPLMVVGAATPDSGNSDGTATAIVNGGTPGFQYLWSDSQAQTTATATGLDAGSYFVEVTDTNGCMASDSVQVAFAAGILQPRIYQAITCWPNPAADYITVNGQTANSKWTLVDAQGRVVASGRFQAGTPQRVSLAHIPAGAYQLLVVGQTTQAVRLIKLP